MKFQTDMQPAKGAGGMLELNAESYAKGSSGNVNVTRHINCCLVPCDQCTGLYTDNIRGDILRIICHHQCHSKKIMATSKSLGFNASNTGMSAK